MYLNHKLFVTITILLLAHLSTSTLPEWYGSQNHETHDYYTLRLNTAHVSPSDIASLLGIEYVGDVGGVQDYHLFSTPKSYQHPHGSVEKRFAQLKEDHNLGNLRKRELEIFSQIQGLLEKQVLKKRTKRISHELPSNLQYVSAIHRKKSIAKNFNFSEPNQCELVNLELQRQCSVEGLF
ncbi:pheromone processing endoprotease [Basidiobolus ranarum]|uniref:Pheromone processing endoprotease n=1 Tax=Basidiobolus ranarum TaxID=34480 RepID=A0ABR2VYR8_9FUNG